MVTWSRNAAHAAERSLAILPGSVRSAAVLAGVIGRGRCDVQIQVLGSEGLGVGADPSCYDEDTCCGPFFFC
jgi:hypothetical protein